MGLSKLNGIGLNPAKVAERLSFAFHFVVMKQLIAIAAVLLVIVAGAVYVAKQGDVDRDVPGRTTDAGRNKLGE
jgi:hypothetical protein